MQGGSSKRRKIEPGAKLVVQRHGGGGGAIRSYNAAEKAAETKVRQQGKKEIRRSMRRDTDEKVEASMFQTAFAELMKKRKHELKAARLRVEQSYNVQAALLSECLRQLEALKPELPAKFVGLDVPKSRYLVKGKPSGKR